MFDMSFTRGQEKANKYCSYIEKMLCDLDVQCSLSTQVLEHGHDVWKNTWAADSDPEGVSLFPLLVSLDLILSSILSMKWQDNINLFCLYFVAAL